MSWVQFQDWDGVSIYYIQCTNILITRVIPQPIIVYLYTMSVWSGMYHTAGQPVHRFGLVRRTLVLQAILFCVYLLGKQDRNLATIVNGHDSICLTVIFLDLMQIGIK